MYVSGSNVINEGALQPNLAATFGVAVGAHTTSPGNQAFYIDNVERAALVLPVEATYTFNLDSTTFATSGGHHLHFSATSDGTHGGGSSYTTGVTNSGASSGTVQLETRYTTTSPLYYYCHDYSGMGGQLRLDISGANLNGSAAQYTLDVYPAVDGTVQLAIMGTAASDLSGNPNLKSNTLSFQYDLSKPSVALSSSTVADGGTVCPNVRSHVPRALLWVSDDLLI